MSASSYSYSGTASGSYSGTASGPPTFKCILAGDGGVGKTTLMKRLITGEFEKKYVATIGVEVRPYIFYTTVGPVCFNVWDTAGQEMFSGLGDGYYVAADCAICMGDVTRPITKRSAVAYSQNVRKIAGNIPIRFVMNKTDVNLSKRLRAKVSAFEEDKDVDVISAKNNYNFTDPFLYLARVLLEDDTIEIVEAPPIDLHAITDDEVEAMENELAVASTSYLAGNHKVG